MSTYEVIDAKPEHIDAIARNVRQADIDEIWATAAILPRDALLISLARAVHSATWMIDGEPAAMGGVNPGGLIWLITTDLVNKNRRAFLQESRRQFDAVKPFFDAFYNFVDVRNRRAIRWLRSLGFHMGAPVPYGVFQKPFLPFVWRAE
jgi:hypothetical protein